MLERAAAQWPASLLEYHLPEKSINTGRDTSRVHKKTDTAEREQVGVDATLFCSRCEHSTILKIFIIILSIST
jgi:hypothetical protein